MTFPRSWRITNDKTFFLSDQFFKSTINDIRRKTYQTYPFQSEQVLGSAENGFKARLQSSDLASRSSQCSWVPWVQGGSRLWLDI